MPRIRFTADPKLPRDWADRPYRKDTEHDMSDDEAGRWIRRGVAEIVADAIVEAPVEAPKQNDGPTRRPRGQASQPDAAVVETAAPAAVTEAAGEHQE